MTTDSKSEPPEQHPGLLGKATHRPRDILPGDLVIDRAYNSIMLVITVSHPTVHHRFSLKKDVTNIHFIQCGSKGSSLDHDEITNSQFTSDRLEFAIIGRLA
jgi:hypothetical protein